MKAISFNPVRVPNSRNCTVRPNLHVLRNSKIPGSSPETLLGLG